MKLLPRNIIRYFSFRDFLIVFLAVVLSVSAGIGVFFYLKRDVLINDDGKVIALKTMKTTVKDVLDQSGVILKPEDYISMPLDGELKRFKENKILIKRAVPVSFLVDGGEIGIMTYHETVRDAILHSPVRLNSRDRLEGTSLDDKIVAGMKIRIVRVNEKYIAEELPVPYRTVTRENNSMDKGQERVVKEGKEGIREKLYRIVMEDGREILRELVNDAIVSAPIDKIIEYGTILNHKTARGDVIRYKKVLNMKATAYTASFKDTGKNPDHPAFGITYTGTRAKKGTIAVDPKVIPLGTKVYVEVAGSTPDYGFARAEDIGGAIKGNLIDLYFDDQDYVDRWGAKRVKVYILLDQ